MKSDSNALYLFDIDGTLVDIMPVHVKAYQAAYRKILGFAPDAHVLLRQFGNVENGIHEKVFSHYKIRDKRKINVIIKEYTKSVVAAVKSTKIRVLPGAKQLLQ
jgi:beta-phosphoglucomutase-like phosphatase (HAD superfamily)